MFFPTNTLANPKNAHTFLFARDILLTPDRPG
jgi:hypothetical protein